MNQGSIKNTAIVLVAAALLASVYALKKILQAPTQQIDAQELSYEMPRARDEIQPYSLAGRRLIRNVHTPVGQTAPISQAAPIAVNTPGAKKVDPKVAAAQAAAKKAEDAKKAAAAKAAAAKRKAQLSVTSVAANNVRMTGFQENNYHTNQGMSGFGGAAVNTTAADPMLDPQQEEDKGKLSIGQWRSLLFAQPTAKNGGDFLTAFQKGEVDEASFYKISEELFGDNAADRQKLGFDLLKAKPSARAFTILLNHYEKAPDSLRADIASVLKTYGDVSHFSILSKLLYSSDARVVQAAQSLLAQTIATLHTNDNNGQSNNGRDARSPGSTPIAAAQFNGFVPALRRLVTSNDAAVAQQAQALLESILAMKPA
jgi:hypothetical protein